MNDFNRSNKVTGIHWLKSPVENVQIKIKLKPQDGILSLPKFEEYSNETNNSLNIQTLENQVEEYTFKWQEKIFSPWEIQRYTDSHNCVSDTELIYHDMIKDLDYVPAKVITRIHEDNHLPLPSDLKKDSKKANVLGFSSCLERLNISEKVERIFGDDTSSMGHLFRSEDNIAAEEQWTAMHVVFDNSDYNEDSRLLLKQETTLLSLYHNTAHNYIIVSPDANRLDLNPYSVEAAGAGLTYAVHIGFEDDGGDEDLNVLLRKLYKKWEKKQKQLLNFSMPPLGKKQFYVTLEIISAADFDMDNLYIEYHVKVPEAMQCSDTLRGRTHASKSLRREGTEAWLFGHIVEISLETEAGTDPPPLKVFLEVISKDWWGRHRTEGYTYLPLTLLAGRHSRQLACSRPEEKRKTDADNRRFFIGGCHLIKDLEVLAQPQLKDANFKFTSTGRVAVQWAVVSQAHARAGAGPAPAMPGTSSASALLLGAEAVLRQYRRARARLAAATRDLGEGNLDGSGDGS